MKKNNLSILAFIAILFLFIRLPGVSLPYHQDEWKTARSVEIGAEAASSLYHPPLTQLSYRAAEKLVGGAHLRFLPLLFSFLSLFLLYLVVKRRAGEKAALLSVFLYTISFYSVLASHMIDTDGALLPFFFLLSLVCYDQWNDVAQRHRGYWLLGFVLALLAGFMVKLSFIIVLGAFLVDYALSRYGRLTKKEITRLSFGLVLFSFVSVCIFFLTKFLYPAFKLDAMVTHALLYAHLSGRNYIQIIVQTIKVLEYLSPLLIVPLLFIKKDTIRSSRIFIVYLVLGGIFYFILFDFSRGALDKYLMYSIVPLSALVAMILSPHVANVRKSFTRPVIVGVLLSGVLYSLNFFHHTVLTLYPKQEWFARALHGQWNMLVPFTGGSGPLGFYVSFLFIASVFLFFIFLTVLARARFLPFSAVMLVLLVSGTMYNLVFIEEYQWGMINGSAPIVLSEALAYIEEHPTVTSVITYNDIGAYELSRSNKYANRFYAVPEYEAVHRERFSSFDGYFLIVDIPRIYTGSYYEDFFNTCARVFETRSREITATIYGC
ncbi:MAG: glycosyltransferase family 39 protein [Candidatus Roizmanbacteria bacterium]|nr:glycosyltransferase family 39 protein [Candidatus Roizmanbacteria bacterium]